MAFVYEGGKVHTIASCGYSQMYYNNEPAEDIFRRYVRSGCRTPLVFTCFRFNDDHPGLVDVKKNFSDLYRLCEGYSPSFQDALEDCKSKLQELQTVVQSLASYCAVNMKCPEHQGSISSVYSMEFGMRIAHSRDWVTEVETIKRFMAAFAWRGWSISFAGETIPYSVLESDDLMGSLCPEVKKRLEALQKAYNVLKGEGAM